MKNALLYALIFLTLFGCSKTYITKPEPVVGFNIYTTDGNKIDGNWAYIIDDSVNIAHKAIRASSHACSAHTYPIEAVNMFSVSIDNAISRLFKNYHKVSSVPNPAEIKKLDLRGTVIINIDEFNPKFSCTTSPGEFYCTASTDVSITARLINYKNGGNRFIHATAQRSADGGDGGSCQNVSLILTESIKKTIKEVLERITEKLSIAISASN